MPSINLVSTLHDPNGIYVPYLAQTVPHIMALYDGWYVTSTPATSAETLAQLTQYNIQHAPIATRHVGESRRLALQMGLDGGAPTHLHYCDFDRLLKWQLDHADELKATVARIVQTSGFMALGRTDRAFQTHPRVQVSAETLTNRLFSYIYDPSWTEIYDVVAGSCALSRAAAEQILLVSAELTNGTDCEWPMIVNRLTDLPVAFWQTEGLEFETATFEPDGVFERAETPDNWHARVALAQASVEAAIRIEQMSKRS